MPKDFTPCGGTGQRAARAPAADWPQWRGPHRDGKSAETGLLKEWKEGGPPLAWQASGLGGGFSSLAIADGRIYTLGYSSVVITQGAGVKQYVQLVGRGLIGVDAKTGKFLWGYNKVANDVANIPTPIIDGDFVFTATGYGTGGGLLELRKDGAGVAADEVYFLPADTFQNHHGGMILDHGYVFAGTGHNKGQLFVREQGSLYVYDLKAAG